MRQIEVCLGSSCFLKGAYKVLDTFVALQHQHGMEQVVRVAGAFCQEHCRTGVSVAIDETIYSVPDVETARSLFDQLFLTSEE